ncbi:GGDEF domain-containing protein [Pectobacterium parmentieri]|uniref:GGDEF domain-containing protein n=1 Tax=Pectobacterium parmentieri TaxID=1905730 RepID=UPI0001B0AEFD|nr:GGDEF domain-containing protein [Pectobacterium parmentieri]ACX90292.1 diguanylate cyclase [Pectobacterium parmentieri WPP163]AOR60851.1 diguanylate cyclase [Pectobacterium parmentieri]AYH03668.1 GGDEF domain-containing protein [Pectobacterium parmentieri]AYH12475.1 GGDEF domain-containing protein [Pectobacterium parmentieri]AYH21191.1 GGDEF domain-containing protein [Pectobacterium parmentieri]
MKIRAYELLIIFSSTLIMSYLGLSFRLLDDTSLFWPADTLLFCFLILYRSRDKSTKNKLFHSVTLCMTGFIGMLLPSIHLENDQSFFEKVIYCAAGSTFFITAWLTLIILLKTKGKSYSLLSKSYIFFIFISIAIGSIFSATFYGLHLSTKTSSEYVFILSRKWFSEELSSGVIFVFLFLNITKKIKNVLKISQISIKMTIKKPFFILYPLIIIFCIASSNITLSVLAILPLIYLSLSLSFNKIVVMCSATGIALNYIYINRLIGVHNKIEKEYLFELSYLFQINTSVIIITALTASFFINGNRKNIKRIELISNHDALTGMLNRRSLNQHMMNIINSIRDGENKMMSLLVLDIDHFKKINDTYGHAVGDNVIRGFSTAIKQHTRPQDLLCRWGGEEFLIIIQGLSKNECLEIAERIRTIIEGSSLAISNGHAVRCTTSIGVSFFHLERIEDFHDAFKEADKLLYIAKEQGRNRVNSDINVNSVQKLIS